MSAQLNGRVCCLLAICCDVPVRRVEALAHMLMEHQGLTSDAALSAATFVLEHFGVVPKEVEAAIVELTKAALSGIAAPPEAEERRFSAVVSASYAPYFLQRAKEA